MLLIFSSKEINTPKPYIIYVNGARTSHNNGRRDPAATQRKGENYFLADCEKMINTDGWQIKKERKSYGRIEQLVREKLGGRLNMRKEGGEQTIGKKLVVGRKFVKRTIG